MIKISHKSKLSTASKKIILLYGKIMRHISFQIDGLD